MIKIAKKSQVPNGKGLTVELPDGKEIALFQIDGHFYAIDNCCPHKGAPLAEGHLEKEQVVCPWHCWKFDLKTGQCSQRDTCVKTYRLIIKGEDIYCE